MKKLVVVLKARLVEPINTGEADELSPAAQPAEDFLGVLCFAKYPIQLPQVAKPLILKPFLVGDQAVDAGVTEPLRDDVLKKQVNVKDRSPQEALAGCAVKFTAQGRPLKPVNSNAESSLLQKMRKNPDIAAQSGAVTPGYNIYPFHLQRGNLT